MSSGQHKIIFTGPVCAGKTTAIAAISDIEPFTTEEAATDNTAERKETTTVAMDYGVMKLGEQERIHLYGTPGQDRFNFMWEILTNGGIGLVLLLDNTAEDPFADLRFYTESFKDFISKGKLVVGVNFMNQNPTPTLDEYHRELQKLNLNPPLFEVDCREYHDVSMLVQSLLYSYDPWIGLQ